LAVAGTEADGADGFQVEIYVNDAELTAAGAGLGMDPYDVLIPVNRFVATEEPATIPAARCGCGVYGCGMTDVTIARAGDRVRWEWEKEVPMSRPVVFDAAAYDREVERAGADRSWETPDRTAGRLVLSSIGPGELPGDLEFDWVGDDWRDGRRFQVCLRIRDEHQVLLDFAWEQRPPEALAAEVRRVLLETSPERWAARWHSIRPGGGPPAVAGPHWQRWRL
jgi:hypothetical protein